MVDKSKILLVIIYLILLLLIPILLDYLFRLTVRGRRMQQTFELAQNSKK